MIDMEQLERSEPLFVNQCTYTKAVLLEFQRKARARWTSPSTWKSSLRAWISVR